MKVRDYAEKLDSDFGSEFVKCRLNELVALRVCSFIIQHQFTDEDMAEEILHVLQRYYRKILDMEVPDNADQVEMS